MADVVISGAGPNGLMLACELALAGVHPVVLDKLPGPSDEPKANGLVGQVIRLLDMRGLYQAFGGNAGPPATAYQWMFSGLPVDLLGLDDNPMHALLIQQPRVVRLLEKRARDLGVDIRWGHEFAGVEQGSDGVTVDVDCAGRPPSARCARTSSVPTAAAVRCARRSAWGSPGARRTRSRGWRTYTYPTNCVLRTAVTCYPATGRFGWGHQRIDRGGYILAMMQPGRLLFATMEAGRLPRRRAADVDRGPALQCAPRARRRPADRAAARAWARTRCAGWTGRTRGWRRPTGRVTCSCLGDAAHVHSPMGGPGLNLGLQDTVNLGWKLAAQLNGWAPPDLLDTYESERRPVGERVMMHSLSQQALMAPGPEVGALRTLFGELLELPEVRRHIAHLLAGSDVRYEVGDAASAGPASWCRELSPRRRPSRRRPVARRPAGAASTVRRRLRRDRRGLGRPRRVVTGELMDSPAGRPAAASGRLRGVGRRLRRGAGTRCGA